MVLRRLSRKTGSAAKLWKFVEPQGLRWRYHVVGRETQLDSPYHRTVLEDGEEQQSRQDEAEAPKLNAAAVVQPPPTPSRRSALCIALLAPDWS